MSLIGRVGKLPDSFCGCHVALGAYRKIRCYFERPTIAKTAADGRIEAVVAALDVYGKPGGGDNQVHHGRCDAARFVVADNSDQPRSYSELPFVWVDWSESSTNRSPALWCRECRSDPIRLCLHSKP